MQRNNEQADQDSFAISRLGFTAANWRLFFGQPPKLSKGAIELPITQRFQHSDFKPEILYLDGRRWIPSQTYFEFNASDLVSLQKKVYIFQSATDALSFFQIRSMVNMEAVFFVLGKNPRPEILNYVKENFAHAKFILCFPDNLMGRVSEIKIAGFLTNVQLILKLEGNRLLCRYGDKEASISLDSISLSKVSKLIGFYPKKIRTLKPKGGYQSFYDLIRDF